MKGEIGKAIGKAIYYSSITPDYYSNPICIFQYTDKESFGKIVNSLKDKIEIIAMFAPRDDICYSVFNNLYENYDELLFNETTSIFLVNRKDLCIRMVKVGSMNRETEKEVNDEFKEKVAIIKIDSVISEYFNKKSYLSYFLYPSFIAAAGVGAYFYLKKE